MGILSCDRSKMPPVNLPTAGGGKAHSMAHRRLMVHQLHQLAAGVALAVFLILVACTVHSGPQVCKLICSDSIHYEAQVHHENKTGWPGPPGPSCFHGDLCSVNVQIGPASPRCSR